MQDVRRGTICRFDSAASRHDGVEVVGGSLGSSTIMGTERSHARSEREPDSRRTHTYVFIYSPAEGRVLQAKCTDQGQRACAARTFIS